MWKFFNYNDIGDVTINNVFTDQEYNDLGMTVRGKQCWKPYGCAKTRMCCESTWQNGNGNKERDGADTFRDGDAGR